MLKWEKLGLIFSPSGRKDWMMNYAQIPSTLIFDDFVRVYFTCRPERKTDQSCVSYSAYVDFDRKDLTKILNVSDKPIISLGKPGTFDEFGLMMSSVVRDGNILRGYYLGWTRMHSVPYNWAIGMAISKDNGETFSRIGEGPILGPTLHEPFLQTCPIVKKINNTWHMWYITGLKWVEYNRKMESVYQIAHAVSDDACNWKRDGVPCVPTICEDECQISSSVIEFDGKYNMFFAYRHATNFRENSQRGYRLGYAWSDDLIKWHRDDSIVGLDVSQEGWDSEMICYPHVFELDNEIYMLYCGNYFGIDGFGCARLLRQ